MIQAGDTLAIHPGALGDVLLAIPALRALRTQHPGCPLVLAAQPRLGHLLASLGLIDRAIDFESLGLGALFTAEPGRVGPSDLGRAGRVVCWFGSRDPLFVENLRALAPGAVVAAPAADDLPVWRHLRRTVGAPLDGGTASIPVPGAALAAGRQALRDAGWDGVKPFILLHPGAGSVAKRWPVDGFTAVTGALRGDGTLAVAVHCGPADADAASAVAEVLGPDVIVLREPPLLTLAGALAGAALYLGNDSGVSHLAAAVGAPQRRALHAGLAGVAPVGASRAVGRGVDAGGRGGRGGGSRELGPRGDGVDSGP